LSTANSLYDLTALQFPVFNMNWFCKDRLVTDAFHVTGAAVVLSTPKLQPLPVIVTPISATVYSYWALANDPSIVTDS
jgi:hypothetical protein